MRERGVKEKKKEEEDSRLAIGKKKTQPRPRPPSTSLNAHQNSSIALALTSALAAGVLGVEGWSGFLYYFAGQAVAASALWAKCAGEPEAFSLSKIGLLAGESLGSTSLLTFILFWSLAHNYVHLF